MSATLDGDGAYLTSVAIRNVRCFGAEQTLSLRGADGKPARWTVILGENGVGKTTLLQLIALLSVEDSRKVEHRLEFEMFERFEYRWERRPPRPGNLAASLRRAEGDGQAAATFKVGNKEHKHEILAGRRGPSAKPHPLKTPPFLCGYGANRRLSDGGLRRRHKEPRMPFLSLFGDVDLRDAEEWLLQADYAAAREPSPRSTAKRALVKDLLVQVLPDVEEVRIGKAEHDEYPIVEARTPYGWVPVRNLSMGYQTLVAWMVDLASRFLDRYEKSGDALAEPAIVLVDEIDLHLHPSWQRSLMGFLSQRFPGTQFIATAHSPLVVQGAEGANVVVLRRDHDHVLIDSAPDEIRNWRVDQILTSDLYGLPSARPPHLDSLLSARQEILTKPKLSATDTRKLRDLEARIGELPGGESPEELRAMALIQRAARQLDKPGKKSH
jgi:energy-coupling factor transporter ATP-binding protein EcfA2